MSHKDIYGVQKILHHPEALSRIRDRQPPSFPIQVHFMPALACNQHCAWCSYGHRLPGDGPEAQGWKNMEKMSNAHLPRDKMAECVADWVEMGVKAVEITGGGEPLIYPYIDTFLNLMSMTQIDTALVTNGTALTEKRAAIFASTKWKWARVSIDASDLSTYVRSRRVRPAHWKLAWKAVGRLVDRKTDEEQRVGVGYVVDNSNYSGIYDGCLLARHYGADNVRISAAFTPHGLGRFKEGVLEEARAQASKAKREIEEEGVFQVNNLLEERIMNLASPRQDYKLCGIKEVLCVIGGDQNVYTCCSLAFNRKGLIGSIKDQSFRELWQSSATQKFLMKHNAKKVCKMECLYERRNKRILEFLGMDDSQLQELTTSDNSIHRNFI